MKLQIVAAGLVLLVAACAARSAETTPASETIRVVAPSEIAAGAYLAEVGGCHDCHTPGWAQTGGQVPEDQLLVGVPVGFSGPWGTSYAANLRLAVQGTDASDWADTMKHRTGLPPMPWSTVNHMSRDDLMAIHAYLSALGPGGEVMPMAVTDGSAPLTPYIWFDPLGPETHPAAP
ncbi:MAG: hypothetical protein Q8S09_00070 [Hyphomonas sp.]|nr:hypothetical protein [Hyphomonas sp.]MDP3457640.1 hypothetical protein [Hyphomonas sp.]